MDRTSVFRGSVLAELVLYLGFKTFHISPLPPLPHSDSAVNVSTVVGWIAERWQGLGVIAGLLGTLLNSPKSREILGGLVEKLLGDVVPLAVAQPIFLTAPQETAMAPQPAGNTVTPPANPYATPATVTPSPPGVAYA